MTENPVPLAIFDFDGTLTCGHLWLGIARHHRDQKIRRLAVYSYLLTHLPFWFASKMKLYSDEKNRAKWGEDLSILFKGFSKEQAEKVFRWVMDNYFLALMHEEVLARLDEHKQQGYKIIILSGMFTEFLEVIGKKLGADYVVGTRMEMMNNVYTGRIVQPLCFGENKARLLNEFLRQNNIKADFNRSYAYADSAFDLPVFKLVGNPVATHPDNGLMEIARDNRWIIIQSSKGNHKSKK